MFEKLAKFLFPEICVMCGEATLENLPLCRDCIGEFNGLLKAKCPSCGKDRQECRCHKYKRFLFYYKSRLALNLISSFKHTDNLSYSDFLGDMIFHAIEDDKKYDCVVYPPRSDKNRIRYGFDQMENLSMRVAFRLGIPCVKALIRNKSAKEQKLLSVAQRRKNTKGLFYADRNALMGYKRILLLDDVNTTGSTVLACRQALRNAGATSISVFTIAKTPVKKAVKISKGFVSGSRIYVRK